MSLHDLEFEKLHKLLDRKLSDFHHWYKIPGQGMLSVYDIFNSPKVDEYLANDGGCKSLVPCAVDEKLLTKRFAIAYRVTQHHKLQNEEPFFCANAQKILNQAREILKDRQKDCAYSAWYRAKHLVAVDATPERIDVEEARRQAAGERQRLVETRRQAAQEKQQLEETRLQAAEDEQRRSEWEKRQAAAREATKKTTRTLKQVVVGLGVLLVIGSWQRCTRQTIPNHSPSIQSTPSPYPNSDPIPAPTDSVPAPEVLPARPAPTLECRPAEPVPTSEVRPAEPLPTPTPEVRRAEPLPTPTPEVRRAEPAPTPAPQPSINDMAFISSINKILLDHDWRMLVALTIDGKVNYFKHPDSTNAFIRDQLTSEAQQMRNIRSTVYPQTFTHEVSNEYSPRWEGPMLYDSITVYNEWETPDGNQERVRVRLTAGFTLTRGTVKIYALVKKILE